MAPLTVSVTPFEVVQQCPHEVAADVDAEAGRAFDRVDVGVEEGDPVGVIDGPLRTVLRRGRARTRVTAAPR